MQRCVSVYGPAVHIRVTFVYQDSRNIDISDHRGAVERRHADVIPRINVGAALQQGQNRFGMSLRPRGVQKRRFTTLSTTGNVGFVL